MSARNRGERMLKIFRAKWLGIKNKTDALEESDVNDIAMFFFCMSMELRLLKKEGLWSMFETRFLILLMFRHLRCSTGLYCTCFSPVPKETEH